MKQQIKPKKKYKYFCKFVKGYDHTTGKHGFKHQNTLFT